MKLIKTQSMLNHIPRPLEQKIREMQTLYARTGETQKFGFTVKNKKTLQKKEGIISVQGDRYMVMFKSGNENTGYTWNYAVGPKLSERVKVTLRQGQNTLAGVLERTGEVLVGNIKKPDTYGIENTYRTAIKIGTGKKYATVAIDQPFKKGITKVYSMVRDMTGKLKTILREKTIGRKNTLDDLCYATKRY